MDIKTLVVIALLVIFCLVGLYTYRGLKKGTVTKAPHGDSYSPELHSND